MWKANDILDSLDSPIDLEFQRFIQQQEKTAIAPCVALSQHHDGLDESLPYGFLFPLDGEMQWVDRETWGDRKLGNYVLPHQARFLQNTQTRAIGLVGGYGSGKTKSLIYKTLQLCGLNQGYKGTLYSATYELATQILIPELEEMLHAFKIQYKYRATPLPKFTLFLPGGETTIFIRAFENKARIIGYNLAWAGIDEIDTIKPQLAASAWKKLQGRLRSGNVRQIFTGSTPEGYRFLYEYFEKQRLELESEGKDPKRALIRASTLDNPFLPGDFVQGLYDEYPEELVKAYVNGQFVNLTGQTVYYCYDRGLNLSIEHAKPDDLLHIGLDFNIGRMAAVVFVDRGDRIHAVGEFVDIYDTPAMINAIQQTFQNQCKNRRVIIYPDASGQQRNTTGPDTNHSLLVQAGFQLRVNPSNPRVEDRINSVNAMFCNSNGDRRLLVNTQLCPQLANALEQQVRDDKGQPDKSRGIDHCLDSAGYVCAFRFPISSSSWGNRQAQYG